MFLFLDLVVINFFGRLSKDNEITVIFSCVFLIFLPVGYNSVFSCENEYVFWIEAIFNGFVDDIHMGKVLFSAADFILALEYEDAVWL